MLSYEELLTVYSFLTGATINEGLIRIYLKDV